MKLQSDRRMTCTEIARVALTSGTIAFRYKFTRVTACKEEGCLDHPVETLYFTLLDADVWKVGELGTFHTSWDSKET
jgi:hypothetical protein